MAQQPQTGGPLGEIKAIQSGGAASIDELREFLGHMRNRSPQEVLGLVAESALIRSTFQAFAVIAVILFGTTGVVFVTNKLAPPPPAVAEEGEPAAQPAVDSGAEPAAVASGTADDNAAAAVDAMGIGETKAAAPNENPLEKQLDSLLDGVK